MPRHRFVHLGINPVNGLPTPLHPAIETHLGTLPNGDWYRYASQNYVVWTDRDLTELVTELHSVPTLGNCYFLATEFSQIDATKIQGWMPMEFWGWLNKPRSATPLLTGVPSAPFFRR